MYRFHCYLKKQNILIYSKTFIRIITFPRHFTHAFRFSCTKTLCLYVVGVFVIKNLNSLNGQKAKIFNLLGEEFSVCYLSSPYLYPSDAVFQAYQIVL